MAATGRQHVLLTCVVAAALLGLAIAVAGPLLNGARLSPGVASPPGPPVPPPPCPTAVPGDFDHLVGERKGPLVPTGAVSAVVCSYEVLDTASLNGSQPLDAQSATEAVSLLNDLPAALPDASVQQACVAMGRNEHRVVFAYADGRTHAIVDISLNCGTAHHDGGVRYLYNAKKLLRILRILR